MVGNVGVNRILGNCLDFRNIRNMNDMVFRARVVLKQHRKAIFINEPGIGTVSLPED